MQLLHKVAALSSSSTHAYAAAATAAPAVAINGCHQCPKTQGTCSARAFGSRVDLHSVVPHFDLLEEQRDTDGSSDDSSTSACTMHHTTHTPCVQPVALSVNSSKDAPAVESHSRQGR